MLQITNQTIFFYIVFILTALRLQAMHFIERVTMFFAYKKMCNLQYETNIYACHIVFKCNM